MRRGQQTQFAGSGAKPGAQNIGSLVIRQAFAEPLKLGRTNAQNGLRVEGLRQKREIRMDHLASDSKPPL